jgi:hypothetical protein
MPNGQSGQLTGLSSQLGEAFLSFLDGIDVPFLHAASSPWVVLYLEEPP